MAPNVLSERETDPLAGLVNLEQRITTACCSPLLDPYPLNNELGWFLAWPGSLDPGKGTSLAGDPSRSQGRAW